VVAILNYGNIQCCLLLLCVTKNVAKDVSTSDNTINGPICIARGADTEVREKYLQGCDMKDKRERADGDQHGMAARKIAISLSF
jgi:hypothetical protein